MADVPWSGGPPSQSELESWLVTTRGMSREDAREIARLYGSQRHVLLTEEQLSEWVGQMVTATNEGAGNAEDQPFAAVQEQAAAIAAEQEARRNARNTRNQALAQSRSQVIRDQVQGYYDSANEMAAAVANSQIFGMRLDESGQPELDEEGQPIEFTAADLWGEIQGLSFNMSGLNLPYTQEVGRRPRRVLNAESRRWSRDRDAFFQGPARGGMSERAANASARRYSGQARALGLGGPGRRARVRGGLPDANFTPSQALSMLGNMSEDQLTQLQQRLLDAGMYGQGEQGSLPTWGVADTATRQAFIQLFMVAAERDLKMPINRLLAELTEENINRMGPPETGPGAPNAAELVEIEPFKPNVTSAATLAQTIDETAQDLFGEFVPQDRKDALIARLQQQEIGAQKLEWERTATDIRAQAQARQQAGFSQSGSPLGGGGQGTPAQNELDAFMSAIAGQETGGGAGGYTTPNATGSGAYGRYQIMPGTWRAWATRAGLGPNAPMTPENQEMVARRAALDYYRQFGNWRDAAIAWYAGPASPAIGNRGAGHGSQGRYPTIQQYADQVMARMAGASGQGAPSGQGGLVEIGGTQYPAIETFDPASEAQAILKAQDPAGWEAHEFANRALEFYQLLGGVGVS